jgi:hypothetical protein
VAYFEQELPLFFSYDLLNVRKQKNTTDKLLTNTKFQCFLNKVLHYSFKKLVISMPSLLQGLHTMSLAKNVPDRLMLQEWECTKLREPPPVPYMPTKDEVQEEFAKLRNLEMKTTIEKDTTLNFLVWQKNGTQEAFLMHVTAVLDAIKKPGTFKDYKKAQKAYVEANKAAELAEAGLALLDSTSTGSKNICKKKTLAKAKEALVKAKETESETKEAEEATNVTEDSMKAGF